jgi:hypothetical protein
MSELEHRLQYFLRNLRIACKAVRVTIPPRELKIKIKKWRQHLKIFLPSAILVLAKAYPNIAL